jgi:DNA-binding transcriptional MerR regulator
MTQAGPGEAIDTARFSLADLVEASGLPERTVQYYITNGLVDPALGRGRSRYYTPAHLQQLMYVVHLREERLSVDEIRERVAAERAAQAAEAAEAASPLPIDHWERITLRPDLELHLRSDAPEGVRALARELIRLSDEWFGDE